MKAEERIALDRFPEDWRYYTLTYPVARYRRLSLQGAIDEMTACNRTFYSMPRIISRMAGNVRRGRNPLLDLVNNVSSRRNSRLLADAYEGFRREEGGRF